MREAGARMRQARIAPRPLLGPRNRRLRRRSRPSQPVAAQIRRAGDMVRSAVRPAIFAVMALAVLGGVAGVVHFALTSPRFAVREIRIVGAQRVPNEDLRGRIGLDSSANIFSLSLHAVKRDAASAPWVKSVDVRRELPSTIVVEIEEYRARAVALLGHLYLVDGQGHVFKRAAPDEAAEFPVITGVDRLDFIADRASAEARLSEALQFLDKYEEKPRPPLGEIHLEGAGLPTLYTRTGATQIRLGEGSLEKSLARLDLVWAALGPEATRVAALYLDNRTRQERVTVRLAASGP
jgi:cell division protein FtsQ